MNESFDKEPLFTFRLFLDDCVQTENTSDDDVIKSDNGKPANNNIGYSRTRLNSRGKNDKEFEIFFNFDEDKNGSFFGESSTHESLLIINHTPLKDSSFCSDKKTRSSFTVASVSLTVDELVDEIGNSHCNLFQERLNLLMTQN